MLLSDVSLALVMMSNLLLIRAQDYCYTPDSQPGNCIGYRYCNYIIQMLVQNAQKKDPNVDNYVIKTICGYDGNEPLVCCPIYPVVTTPRPFLLFFKNIQNNDPSNNIVNGRFVLPTNELHKCGMSNATHTRVVGGSNAQLNAWPWYALLGYNDGTNQVKFLCGGTLITQRHVLTAAHCINNNLILVRLGEHDLSTTNDGAQPIDLYIEKKVVHEEYNAQQITNDIGIIKLQQNAPFSEHIRPICLPVSEMLKTRDLTNYLPFVAGFGSTSFKGPTSNILKEVQLQIVSNKDCENSYKSIISNVFDNKLFCAGSPFGGRDACQGDSGGPLMLPQLSSDGTYYYYNLIGIVSFGYECARIGYPGVYTRITYFIPWIERNLNQ